MKTRIKTLLFLIAILLTMACAVPTAYVTPTPVGSPAPTPTAILTDLEENMCLELVSPATLYDDTLGHWSSLSHVNMPKGTRFIYSGAQNDDYIFVSYGEKQGWLLVNYVRECQ